MKLSVQNGAILKPPCICRNRISHDKGCGRPTDDIADIAKIRLQKFASVYSKNAE